MFIEHICESKSLAHLSFKNKQNFTITYLLNMVCASE